MTLPRPALPATSRTPTQRLVRPGLACALVLVAWPALASGPAAPEPAAAEVQSAPDPLQVLRQRLANRLEGQRPGAGAGSELRVVVRPPPTASAVTPAAPPKRAEAAEAATAPTPAVQPVAARLAAPPSAAASAPAPERVARPPARATAPAPAAPRLATNPVHRSGDVILSTAPRAAPSARPAAAPRRSTPAGPVGHEAQGQWAYLGPAGPQAWAALRPEFKLCGAGQRQSPIDIREGLAVDLEPVQFNYQPSRFSVIDNGRTIQARLAPGNSITLGGRRYALQHLQFHRPSEERIDGRQFEMSVHLVHQDDEGRMVIVAVLLDKGPAQPAVQLVWNNLPLEKHDEVPARVPLDPSTLLPADSRYYTYMGSLTTPPCTEGVQWVVMRQPMTMAPEQIDLFSRIYPMNARPLQQASGRRILQSQ